MKILNKTATQSIKYIFVGIFALLVDNSIFYLSSELISLNLLISTILALSSGFVVSFYGNRIFVFDSRDGKAVNTINRQIFLYFSLFIFNIAFSYLFIYITGKLFELNPIFAKMITTCIIVVWNFAIYKIKIFNNTKD